MLEVSKSVDGTMRATITVTHRVGTEELVKVGWEVLRHCPGEGRERLAGLTREALMEEVEIWFERQGRGYFFHFRFEPERRNDSGVTVDLMYARVRELFPEFEEAPDRA
jgi:hypothetical protein